MGRMFGARRGGGSGRGGSSFGALPGGGNRKLIIILITAAALVLLGIKGFYIVQPAERGVVQRLGSFHMVTTPGPHLMIPFIDKVTVINVDQVNKFGHRAQMLTRDENIEDITLTVQYRVQDAANFLFRDADPVKTIYSAVESALREVTGKSGLDEIITQERSTIAAMVKQNTQKLLNFYQTGLVVTNINIQDAKPPEEVKDAFDDATRAMADKERVQNQAEAYANDIVPRARGAAARQIENAKAYTAKVVSEAKGESKRFLELYTEYSKARQETRQRLYLETMQDVLSDTSKVILDVQEGSGNVTFLPLDKLMGPSAAAASKALPGYESLQAESEARKVVEKAARDLERQRNVDRARRNR
ncbi:MAG TPA: FtsH protease activity modulator HflK [Chromatiaceae bacterium]|nr:FtsH protease activity modulator HflK [Chromatiaceae bacterium]